MLYKDLIKNKGMSVLFASVLGLLSLFLLVQTIKIVEEIRFVGSGVSATNTISVRGEGKINAIPDLAVLSFGVSDTQNTVARAQANAAKISNQALAYLTEQKIAEKDIQTTSYNTFPKYRYVRESGKQVLEGYKVSQNITVKVRDTEVVGTILAGLGEIGVQNINGPSFQIDNPDTVKAEARDKAISQAQQKAKKLAKSLGVDLIRVVSFSENNSGGTPVFARSFSEDVFLGSAVPEIPVGENEIRSQVTITYEIR